MGLFSTDMHFAVMTTVTGQVDLSIVVGRCFLDLLLDDVECVHWKPPEFG